MVKATFVTICSQVVSNVIPMGITRVVFLVGA